METFESALKQLLKGKCDAIRHEQMKSVVMRYDGESQQLKKGTLLETGVIEPHEEHYPLEASHYEAKWEMIHDMSEILQLKDELYAALYKLTSHLDASVKPEIAKVVSIIEKI